MQTNLAQGVADQSANGAESGATGATGGGDVHQDIGDNGTVQSSGQDNGADDVLGDVPPELQEQRTKLLKDYHEKTQKIAAERRQMELRVKDLEYSDGLLKQVMVEPWFKKAYDDEKARRQGHAVPDLTDESYEQIKSDPRAFREYIHKYAESIVESKMGGKLNNADRELRELKLDREKERLGGKYSDFKDALEAGHLDRYIKAGKDHETAYALYSLNEGKPRDSQRQIEEKAREVLQQRRAGAVGGTGVPSIRGERVIKAKNFDEFYDKAMEAAKGNSTANFRAERG